MSTEDSLKTGFISLDKQLENSAANIANSLSGAFKKTVIQQSDLPYTIYRAPGSGNEAEGEYYAQGIQLGNGVNVVATKIDLTPGAPEERPGQPFSLAIQDNTGNAFFIVTLPNGEQAYTRDGAFQKDNQGYITTRQGYKISPEVIIPTNLRDTVEIDNEGFIKVKPMDDAPEAEPQILGRIQLAKFTNPSSLTQIGNGLYQANHSVGEIIEGEAGGDDFSGTSILQGYLEASNVNSVTEMMNTVKFSKNIGFLSKILEAKRENDKRLINS